MAHKGVDHMDLVWGIEAIASLINRSDRQTLNLCQNGDLPVRKVGNRYVIERSKLIEFFTRDAT